MDYKEAYDDICQKLMSAYNTTSFIEVKKAIGQIHPELRESEDEIIRNRLINLIRELASAKLPIMTGGYFVDGQDKKYIAYLEKQKELDKMIVVSPEVWDDAISDAFENGKKEGEKQKEHKPEHFELKAGKWYICHRAFCCRADHLTVKEGERFMCEKDGVVKGFIIKEPEKYFIECSAPAPMEDEQKEPHYTKRNALFDKCVENCDPEVMKEVSDKVDEMLGKEQKSADEQFPPLEGLDAIKAKYYDDGFKNGFDEGVASVKPAEWSEEGEDMLNSCISSIEEAKENRYAYKETDGDTSYDHEIAWLKSLRPFWKPSEWQMSMLLAVINDPNNAGSESCYLTLKSIYEQLKKL